MYILVRRLVIKGMYVLVCVLVKRLVEKKNKINLNCDDTDFGIERSI